MYLGIDLGTSEVKVILINEQQRILATGRAALTIERPHPLWSEQSPEQWWIAMLSAVEQIKNQVPKELAQVRGIGLSGQMHGAVLLDKAGATLRPAILWNDMRASAECEELQRRVPDLHQITGNLAMAGLTAPKLLWVAQHEPDIFRATAKVLLPKDYLRFRMTGDYISDMSDASGTLWLDIAKRDWSESILNACNMTRTHMPTLIEGSASGGLLAPKLAQQWGMGNSVVVAGGAGDNAASAIGMGAITTGESFISLGTSGVFFVANDTAVPNTVTALHTFCHALPNCWHQMGVMLSAASCLRWAAQLTRAENEKEFLADIEAANGPGEKNAPLFLPYLSGERTPHNDPFAKGVWFGLSHTVDRGLLGYSVLEGVAFGLRENYLALQDAGNSVKIASLVGGASSSTYWAKLLASALDLPLSLNTSSQVGAALGAARLAMLAANPDYAVASVCSKTAPQSIIEPNPSWTAALLPRFERYRTLYANLRTSFIE